MLRRPAWRTAFWKGREHPAITDFATARGSAYLGLDDLLGGCGGGGEYKSQTGRQSCERSFHHLCYSRRLPTVPSAERLGDGDGPPPRDVPFDPDEETTALEKERVRR